MIHKFLHVHQGVDAVTYRGCLLVAVDFRHMYVYNPVPSSRPLFFASNERIGAQHMANPASNQLGLVYSHPQR